MKEKVITLRKEIEARIELTDIEIKKFQNQVDAREAERLGELVGIGFQAVSVGLAVKGAGTTASAKGTRAPVAKMNAFLQAGTLGTKVATFVVNEVNCSALKSMVDTLIN